MNVLLYIKIAAVCFALSSRIYARYISRFLGEDAQNPTPAQICNDGRDYVVTKRYVFFAHHFSAIASAAGCIYDGNHDYIPVYSSEKLFAKGKLYSCCY